MLRELGVLYWSLDADKYENDPRLDAIRKVHNYSYTVSGCGRQAGWGVAGAGRPWCALECGGRHGAVRVRGGSGVP